MKVWPGIVLAPLLALTDQGAAFAFVAWSCANQREGWLHAVHVVFLVATLATLLPAWRAMHASTAANVGAVAQRQLFLARMSLAIAALSALVILAMWIPHWALSPCYG